MTKQPRWIRAATAEAAACRTRMPWERGLRRAAAIARRARGRDAAPAAAGPLRRAS